MICRTINGYDFYNPTDLGDRLSYSVWDGEMFMGQVDVMKEFNSYTFDNSFERITLTSDFLETLDAFYQSIKGENNG